MLVMRTSDDAGVTWAPAKIVSYCDSATVVVHGQRKF